MKKLDYIITRDYDLGVKIEDSALSDPRRSSTGIFHVDVTFHPRDTQDPEVKKVIELTFRDVDYNAVVLGNEAEFIAALKGALVAKHSGVIFVHFELRKGSVIATFDMITSSSNVTNVINELADQVTSGGGLSVSFNGNVYTTDKMKTDDKIYQANSDDDDDSIVVSKKISNLKYFNKHGLSEGGEGEDFAWGPKLGLQNGDTKERKQCSWEKGPTTDFSQWPIFLCKIMPIYFLAVMTSFAKSTFLPS